jgi:hypothetical protein
MNAKNVISSKLKDFGSQPKDLGSKPKDFGSQPKDLPLTKRYGKIGIAAVEAAARYHKKGDKAKSTAAGGDAKQKRQVLRGTSPKRV